MSGSPAGDLDDCLDWQTEQVPVDHESAIGHVSATARRRARRLCLGEDQAERAAIVAAELASNLRKHAAAGSLLTGPSPDGHALDLWAVDSGPGMRDVGQCMDDGYSTTGTLGAGLGSVRRMADQFAIWSRPARGTAIFARLPAAEAREGKAVTGPRRKANAWDAAAAICLPAAENGVTGDGYRVSVYPDGDRRDTQETATILIADGLGHGPPAAEATTRALTAFTRLSATPGVPLPTMLTQLHNALTGTRGAAALLVRIRDGYAETCGVGNTAGVILADGRAHALLAGQPGTLGARIPTLTTRRHSYPRGSVLILHTDGIRTRWQSMLDADQLSQPPALLAALLAGSCRRPGDDATVVTVPLS